MPLPVGPGQSVQLLLHLADFINSRKISYAAIDALAAAFLGSIRASVDADALIALNEDPDTFCRDLRTWIGTDALKISHTSPDLFDPVRGVICIRDSYGNQVDLILGIQGIEKSTLERAIDVEIFSKTLKVVCAEDFIVMKLFAGSALDLEDAKNIFDIQRNSLDLQLIQRLVGCYGDVEKERLAKLII